MYIKEAMCDINKAYDYIHSELVKERLVQVGRKLK